ncbi:meiosis-specific protein ASY2-like [Brassica napus]|uniref:meiosis-specific protein ASY2-like n=1 Tax=Brassica napus TaxID=3708 RepID=UPI002078509F|nr:meiosis-specific protein ASY2-like [Brassica napus]XP_048620910.1 meiosis-specific protein ASY2-like [Brassica napus]XP_048631616.1 meiosis-specific protein ASY2-like [Brassica napus]
MAPGNRLSREEKGKDIATSPSPARDADGSPLEDFDIIHRDALRDTENMSLSQRLLVADAHRQFREEAEENVVNEDREASGSEAPSLVVRPRRRAHRRGRIDQSDRLPAPRSVPFDEVDCRPVIYHPGGIFEELPSLPPEALRDPRVQSWGNVFGSCSSHETVKRLLRECGGAGVTFIIPSAEQRPWSPPVGYQCVYESYFKDQTKLWFPIPRLITSYAFRRDIAISQLLNGSLRIAVMLMVMAAEMDVSMSVRVFEELTFTKAEPNGIFSVKMRASYNVLTGHPNKTQDWQRAYFFVKSDEHAFEEPPGDDYRVLWNQQLVRHPNTIAYPEKFFETAQLIATHSHLRWPDLSREWIRRQQARIARVDWESRLPCVLGPRRSRLSLFTRKQQKLLNQARKMEGVPDLSALLKGKLQMLSTTPSSAGASEARPVPVDGDANSEPPAQSSPKKKTNKVNKAKAKDGSVPLEVAPSSANVTEAAAKKKKKKGSKKRSREEASVEARETSAAARDDDAEKDDPAGSTRGSPEERPKKKSKKKAAEDDGTSAPEIPSRSGETATEVGDGSRGESPSSKGAPSSSARETGAGSGGSLPRKTGGGVRFPDRVEFLYDEATPLVLNPLRCAELTRQIRGGTKELPPVEDLYFKKEYIDAAMAGRRSDGSVNYLVEKYDSTLKQTMVQLGASDKLARTRLSVIERLRAENKKAGDKAAKEKEVLRVKFEELEDKLKSDRLAKKDALREKTRLERLVASLEKEKAELEEERDAVVGTLVKERQRLRDSRVQEVTRERIKVQTAMADKSTRCIGKVKGYLDRVMAREKAKNLYGQASGTKKCLEMIRDSGVAIPPSMINIFSEQEKMYEAEVANLYLEPFSDDDFALSPLNLPSRFVNEELMGVLDPYGSNVGLIGHESASQLITSREATEDPIDEPMVDITSALSERTVVPEGNTVEERLDGSEPEETGDAIQTDTGDVAAEDPVLVSSSEEREGDEVGEEETRSSPALAEEVDPILPVSDPPAPVEGLGDQVVERETTEALDPSRDDQDVVV